MRTRRFSQVILFLVFHQVKLSTTNVIIKYERRMEGYALKKWESTLNLCVHAHGHDVDPIIKAFLKLIIPLV